MRLNLNDNEIFAVTGGRKPEAGKEWIIFVHGAGGSHIGWSQQTRALAYDGYNVLAPDLPGHGSSAGEPFNSVEEMADWYLALMDELKIDEAHLVNHSMGGLISLELAAKHPERVKSIAFIATAMEIPVNEKLIELAKDNPPKAYDFMHMGFYGKLGSMHDSSVPGSSLVGSSYRIMEHNPEHALYRDLQACNNYQNGKQAAGEISCPTICLLAEKDAMVRMKTGLQLSDALAEGDYAIFEGAGHMLMNEYPREINEQLRKFYAFN